MENVREELDRLIQQRNYGYAAISRLLGRNASYIQQFIKRGSPRKLDDEDRRKLASFFGVDEQTLGGPALPVNDGLVALKDGKMIVLRVPYPMGFYAKGFDGRIDDPKAGWKGRGLWTASGDRTPWLREGGKGSLPLAVHFQLRPDPLAR